MQMSEENTNVEAEVVETPAIEHEISAEDLELNPELVEEGVVVGDVVELTEEVTE